ncbi:LytR C-terminal domain-containing protein [Streptomyces sp. NPDC050560]|uniref:LCP family protein n=1 Tax=Streptomyces sp. NPDC050560 TaxID=3365630 RepID=UPI00379014AB
MNDRYDGHDGYQQGGPQYEIVGYDEYGRPVHRQVAPPQGPATGSYPASGGGAPYGYDDPYGTGQQPPVPPQDPYGTGSHRPPRDPYGTGHQAPVPPQDPYAQGPAPHGSYAQDPYGTGTQRPVPPQDPYRTGTQRPVPPQDPYGTGPQRPVPPYDPYGTGQQPVVPPQGQYGTEYGTGSHQPPQDLYATGPQAPAPPQDPYGGGHRGGGRPGAPYPPRGGQVPADPYGPGPGATAHIPRQQGRGPEAGVPGEGPGGGDPEDDYETGEFSFVEEPDEDSEDVIDWLKFTESRTERREEARRRGRHRVVALIVALVVVVAGGVGYLWSTDRLPGLGGDSTKGGAAAGPQDRDVIVVHLHNTKGGGTSTALLVNNATTKRGSTILLPNSLGVTDDDGSTTTLAKSVDDDGSAGTRDSLDTLLGTSIQGTWRLDTPYLDNLVELVGNIDIDTNTDVPDTPAKDTSDKGASDDAKGASDEDAKGGSVLVRKGENQTLSGPMAVAYATYSAPGEPATAQLERFGQVMLGVLRKLSSDPGAATTTVETLAQILDPSLSDKDLGAFLAKLADHAKVGDYKTTLLAVKPDGTLSQDAVDSVVKNDLGGAVKAPDQGQNPRVGVQNATGAKDAAGTARVDLLNGGYTYVDAGNADTPATTSQVRYGDAAHKTDAAEVAKTLDLPDSAVKKGKVAANADVSVVLGSDFDYKKPSQSP